MLWTYRPRGFKPRRTHFCRNFKQFAGDALHVKGRGSNIQHLNQLLQQCAIFGYSRSNRHCYLTRAFGADSRSYEHRDEDSIPFDKAASSLTSNAIHKICPGTLPESPPLGQPICGDETAFSFSIQLHRSFTRMIKKQSLNFQEVRNELILEMILKNICDLRSLI